ncbi:MAG TPA: biotin carboxylase N-terminal domain-containing protein [Streptosporangiaceae bacterium]|nr:biotin carboxylase N-terminal domain-containing protein [Streptosporangiaceae bacterium]
MSNGTFSRVAVVNRGEPAVRLINAVREWNAEGRPPLRVIAVYTAADRRATFVREADEAVLIGPADPGEAFAASPYLDYAELERALRECRADAVWPGWGFVSEKAEFAELCERLGIIFIGPPADVMRRLGDKIESKRLAEQAGVPLAAWSGGPVADLAQARAAASSIGYPLMVKATAGGGGRGIRFVPSAEHLDEAFERASSEAGKTAGDATVFLERAIRGGHHVEVQVVADAKGAVWTLGVRDCSVQRRNQKVIEESASVALPAEQEKMVRAHAAELIRAAGYVNAATVEFLYEPRERLLSFLEVNTRLQVEHPVTEATTGLDIVKLQLHIAAGGALADVGPGEPPVHGHAIEARLTAEDPERDFAPAPGLIERLALPAGPGIRVDTGVSAGDVIPPQFDSMIAKVIAWGRDRGESRARLSRALRQTAAVVKGGTTNKGFLLDLLAREEFVRGEVDTTWLDTMMADGYAPPRRTGVALLATAFEAYEAQARRQQDALFTSAERGRPEVGHETWHQADVRVGSVAYQLRVSQPRPARYRVELDGHAVEVDVERSGRFELSLGVGGQHFDVLSVAQGPDYLVEVDGAVHRISGGEAGLVRAPAPAMVVAITVGVGDQVAEGDVVAIVESMKLETALRAPAAGRVAEVLADVNTQVETGAKLLRIEQDPELGAGHDRAPEARVDLTALAGPGRDQSDPAAVAADALAALRAMVLGFDIDADEAGRQLSLLAAARAQLAPGDRGRLAGETGILRIFADLSALWRNRRVSTETLQDEADDEAAHNQQEYLHAYLRSMDADAEGLPESFRIKLRRTLAHYGVTGLEPAPELRPALYRIFLAHRRAATHVPVVAELLRWRLRDPLPDDAREDYRAVLEQLVSATQLRYPAVGDLARQVRYRCFDAPAVAAERALAQQEVRAELDRLSSDPQTRAAQVDAIVASGAPILGVFTERDNAVMLEVMTRRYYQIRPLENVRVTEHSGRPLLTAEYTHDGQDYLVIATVAEGTESPAESDLPELATSLPAGRAVLVDLYVTAQTPGGPGDDADARAVRVRAKLGVIPSGIERVTVALLAPSSGGTHPPGPPGEETTPPIPPEPSAVQRRPGDGWPAWFTFRPGPDGVPTEDRTQRDLHPMVAERLGLWRFSAFELTRLPAAPDVHLFRIRGREVPDDQRLMVLTDVRDVTVLRDERGRVRGLPQLERALDDCLDSLRAARSADRELARLDWNRVKLYLWPVVDAPLGQLDQVIRSLVPRTEGLGLEQVMVQFKVASPDGGVREQVLRMSRPPGAGLTLRITDPPSEPLRELNSYTQKVIRARRRGTVYPYELIPMIIRSPDPGGAPGTFTEYDLDGSGSPAPVVREPGLNTANLVLGVVSTPTARYPEGMRRVVLMGDPTRALGALAEPECRRVLAALDLARRLDAPVEWFAISAGAKISMDSGTETMDWISRALRGIVEFTQAGGEINVVVTGINVGAQPYWNAEATMLMHTKGILIMTPDSAMVLTGKHSLDYSGGVSAEDNFGIGGYDRIMGPNGEAQYWAPDLSAAVDVLLAHYQHTYVAPGERFPRPAPTADPDDRDISGARHIGSDFSALGEVFGAATNPERKKPFDIRSLLRGVADADHPTLERWADMADAESAVVLDAHLGGQPVAMIGFESRPLPRHGLTPVDGPSVWTAGTLFPLSSKKTARAINAASGNRPLVILANLSGFDGSPESLRRLQLEYGAEIGRAVVNFDGPIVFCVVSRYHGGAFVVFSGTLNDTMEVAAVAGSYASVIGGAPAAAVVFAAEVNKRTSADPRVAGLQAQIAAATSAGDEDEASRLRAELASAWPSVHAEKLGQMADEFDAVHSIERAHQVGSVQAIVPPARLRSYLIDAVRRGMERTLAEDAR